MEENTQSATNLVEINSTIPNENIALSNDLTNKNIDLNTSLNTDSEIQKEKDGSNLPLTDENNEKVETEVKKSAKNKQQNKENLEDKNFASRPCQLALSRIKTIMKLDPELNLTSKDSIFLVAKATELFVDFLSKESYKFTSQGSRKTIQRKDIDQAVNSVDVLSFLDAALD